MLPFILQFATAAPPDPSIAEMRYDPALQLNVMPDGSPVITHRKLVQESLTTTSTAGSKTHFDD